MRNLSDNKTGTRYEVDGVELVEWKCPHCAWVWLEYSHMLDYPEYCPGCGCGLVNDEE